MLWHASSCSRCACSALAALSLLASLLKLRGVGGACESAVPESGTDSRASKKKKCREGSALASAQCLRKQRVGGVVGWLGRTWRLDRYVQPREIERVATELTVP